MTAPDNGNAAPAENPVPAADAQLRDTLRTWTVAAVLVAAFVGIDVLTARHLAAGPGSIATFFVAGLLLGLCIGQVNLIAVWSSLAPGNIVVRVSWGSFLTMAMWYALVLGHTTSRESNMRRDEAITLIIVLFIGVVALQIPLWVAKKAFRWRLIRSGSSDETWRNEDRQFHVGHMLIAMFFVAAALSPMRQVLPPEDRVIFPRDPAIHVLVPLAILCNFLATIPCIWWAFASAKNLVGFAALWLFYSAVLTVIEYVAIYLTTRPSPGQTAEQLAMLYTANVSQCAAVITTLLILRSIGFRLIRTPRRATPVDPVSPSA